MTKLVVLLVLTLACLVGFVYFTLMFFDMLAGRPLPMHAYFGGALQSLCFWGLLGFGYLTVRSLKGR